MMTASVVQVPELLSLIGKHVYTSNERRRGGFFNRYSPTARREVVTVRGRVVETQGKEVMLELAGNNNPEFDGRRIVVHSMNLILKQGGFTIRTEEDHGALSGTIGVWTDAGLLFPQSTAT